jgi:hypothetical protein
MDKRFEQIDKRFEFLQIPILALLAGVIGSPFLLDFLARRREEANREAALKTDKVLVALRELAQRDTKVERALHVAGIQ